MSNFVVQLKQEYRCEKERLLSALRMVADENKRLRSMCEKCEKRPSSGEVLLDSYPDVLQASRTEGASNTLRESHF